MLKQITHPKSTAQLEPCVVPCELCGATQAETIRTKDRHGEPLHSVICRDCGLVWTDPRPEPEKVRKFYESEYRLNYKQTYQPKLKHTHRSGVAAVERYRRFKHLLQPGMKILDVGAGSGELVYMLRATGHDASGFEPNEGYAKYCREVLELPVNQGFWQDQDIVTGSQDLVTTFHTVEHLETPFNFMQRVNKWLKVGGYFVVEVPNSEATCQHPHSQFHIGHLYHFNLATMQTMQEKAGFKVKLSYTSPDGGNIMVISQKLATAPVVTGKVATNYAQVSQILLKHTDLRHRLTIHPYIRPLRKFASNVGAKLALLGKKSGKEVLDTLAQRLGCAKVGQKAKGIIPPELEVKGESSQA